MQLKLQLRRRTSETVNAFAGVGTGTTRAENCFVRLHPSTIQQLYHESLKSFLDNISSDSSSDSTSQKWQITDEDEKDVLFLPLKITFHQDNETNENAPICHGRTMYVSYNGGILYQEDAIEFNNNVIDSISKTSDVHVDVQPLYQVRNADEVHLEPMTTNDWELMEIFADELEAGLLLNQVSIVYPNQVLPLLVGTDIIYLRVLHQGFLVGNDTGASGGSNPVPEECLRLVSDSQVVVSPKPRRRPRDNPDDGPKVYKKSMSIRIHPTMADFSKDMIQLYDQFKRHAGDTGTWISSMMPCPPIFSAWMHPDTLSLRLDGWDEVVETNNDSVSNASSYAFVMIRKSKQSSGSTLNKENKQSFAVVKIISSDAMPLDSIALHPDLRLQIDVAPLMDFVQLQILVASQVKEKVENFKRNIDDSVSLAISPLKIRDEMEHMVQLQSTWRYPEDFIYLPASGYAHHCPPCREVTSFRTEWRRLSKSTNNFQFDQNLILSRDSIISLSSVDASPLLYKVALNRKRKNGTTLINLNNIFLHAHELPLHIQSISQSDIVHSEINIPNEYMLNILPTSNAPTESILDAIENVCPSLLQSGTGIMPNHLILKGEKGTGKTYFSLMVAAKLRMVHHYATSYFDCRQLQSSLVRLDKMLLELTDAFKRSLKSSPSLLILDNLDELIPNTDPDTKGEGQKERMNPTLVNQAKLLSDHVLFLIRGMQKFVHHSQRGVTLIITCQDSRSIHHRLRSLNMTEMKVPLLIDSERTFIFDQMLREKFHLDDNSSLEIKQFTKEIEGYSPYDLKVIVSQIAMKQRYNRQGLISTDQQTLQTNIEKILSKYVPLSCRSLHVHQQEPDVKWSEIGGLFQAKLSLSDAILRPMKYKLIYQNLPITIPKGILLYGPPGCGKTCIIPALAKECNFNLVTCHGPELFDKYIGASEAKVRKLFEKAYAVAPSILFLDEFDSLAPRRGSDNTGVTDRVVNQLLTYLDGVEVHDDKDVYIIAASSRPDKIDPALLRPGRLERHIYIGYAEQEKEWYNLFSKIALRKDNLKEELKDSILDNSFESSLVSGGIPYLKFSAADIMGILDTAHIKAVHEYLNLVDDTNDECKGALVSTIHLMDAFSSSKPSLPKSDRVLLAQAYVPLLGHVSNNEESYKRSLGLDPSDNSITLGDDQRRNRQLKTTLK